MTLRIAGGGARGRVIPDVLCTARPGEDVECGCVLKDGAAVSPGTHRGGCVTLQRFAFIGTGASVLSQVRIGQRAVVAAVPAATGDVPDRVLVMGTPGHAVERLGRGFDWKRVM